MVGVFNLRGSIIPLVDLRVFFNLTHKENSELLEKKIAIIEYGDHCIGLLFDTIGEVFHQRDYEKIEFLDQEI